LLVYDADYPFEWYPVFEGERNWDDNDDSYALYPFVMRKEMFLYWDSPANTVLIDGFEDVEFPVKGANDHGEHFFSISEDAPALLWLAEGVWTFTEEYVDWFEKGYENIVFETGVDYPDWTYPNAALFDLWIEKHGPQWSIKGDEVTFTYLVHNDGAPVTPVVEDDKCAPVTLVDGDTDTDGLIDPDEVWEFECTMVPDWTFPDPFTNTVTVWDEEGEIIDGWHIGGDVNFDNNTATYTLYPFVLRKAMFMYWDSPANTIPIDGFEDLEFKVAVKHDGAFRTNVWISEDDNVKLFLSEGEWKFVEKDLAEGFVSGYADITYLAGDGYPDWTFPNVALFDLSVEKKLWKGEVVPGQTITYKYKVKNAGPASVTPIVEDDKCAPLIYKWGDGNDNAMVDPGETWVFKCRYKVTEKVDTELTNTVTVWDEEGETIEGWHLGGDTNLANNSATLTLDVGWHGCAAWCWRHHSHLDDWPDGYEPGMLVGEVFGLWHKLDLNRDGEPDTLEDALSYRGGGGTAGFKRKLLKAAVTALLNEATFGELFPAYASEADLIKEVKRAYKSGKRWKMKRLMNELNFWNMGFCPL
jgi:hypothetical protein